MFLVVNVGLPLAVTYLWGRDLPGIRDICHGAAKALWTGVSESEDTRSLARQITVVAKKKAIEETTKILLQKPDEVIENLLARFQDLQVKITNHPNDGAEGVAKGNSKPGFLKEERGQALQVLAFFLKEHKKILAGATEADGYTLIEIDLNLFGDIGEAFKADQIDLDALPRLLASAIVFLDKVEKAQTGPVAAFVQKMEAGVLEQGSAPGQGYLNKGIEIFKSLIAPKSTDPKDALLETLKELQKAAAGSDKGKEEMNLPEDLRNRTLGFIFQSLSQFDDEMRPIMISIRDSLLNKIYSQNFVPQVNKAIERLTTAPSAIGVKSNKERGDEAQRELLERVIEEPKKFPIPADLGFDNALRAKLDEVGDLVIKMGLTDLIAPSKDPKKTFIEIYNEAKGQDEDFYKALDRKFNRDEPTFIQLIKYRIILTFFKPFLEAYSKEVVLRIKNDLFRILNRTPQQRITDVYSLVLAPINNHMAAFYSLNEQKQKSMTTPPGQFNQDSFQKLIFADESNFNRFADAIVARYAPSISSTIAIAIRLTALHEKIRTVFPFTEWTVVQGLYAAAKASAIWLCFLKTGKIGKTGAIAAALYFTGALSYCVDAGSNFVSRRLVKAVVIKNFFKTENNTKTTHSRYQHFINLFLHNKLKKFNASQKSSKPASRTLISGTGTQTALQVTIKSILDTIPLSQASGTIASLQTFFEKKPTLFKFLAGGTTYDLTAENIAPSISREFLREMESFFSDEKRGEELQPLFDLVWNSVSSVVDALKTGPKEDEEAIMRQTELDMQKQLALAVKLLVKEGVATTLDPSKEVQKTVDATITVLEKDTLAFMTIWNEDFSKVLDAWRKLSEAVLEMKTQFEATKSLKVSNHGNNILIKFKEATANLAEEMRAIETARAEKSRFEEHKALVQKIGGQVLSSIAKNRTQKLSFLADIPDISPALKNEIAEYKEYLENNYLQTPSNADVENIQNIRKGEFETVLKKEYQDIDLKITASSKKIVQSIEQIKTVELPELESWKNNILKTITILSEDVTSNLAKGVKFTGVNVNEYFEGPVKNSIEELINYKTKEYHWNGVLSGVMQAATKMFASVNES